MNPLNVINLVMFATTAGHHGRLDTHKYVLNHFEKNYGLSNFGALTAAIKVHNANEAVFSDMAKDFGSFSILKEVSTRRIQENPHQNLSSYGNYILDNYCHSIANAFSLVPFRTEFVLFNEDDRATEIKGDYKELISQALNILQKDDNIYSIHFGGPDDSIPEDEAKYMFLSGPYSFHNHLVRTDKIFNVCQYYKSNYQKFIGCHPEMTYENIIKTVYPNSRFLRFNPKIGYNLNIGQNDYQAVIDKYNLTLE